MNRGKEFESLFLKQWKKCFPNSFIFRLKDDVSNYKYTAANPADFICFTQGRLYLIETKTVQGNTFPFSNLSQYDKLSSYSHIDGLVAGVVIWFYDHNRILFVPIQTCKQMKDIDGLKSINIKTAPDKYYLKEIPSIKRRVFLDSDYRILTEVLEHGEIEEVYKK